MQVGSFVAGDVVQFTSRITVAGVERAHASWSVERDLVGDLPDQVVASSGIRQATGTIVWADGPDVATTSPNPWNASTGWLPNQGDVVGIYVSDGVTEWPQFAGVIDENTGHIGGLPSSTIVDYIDYLSRPVSHSPVLRLHPPKTEGGDYMAVGMSSAYPVDRALRACGFYATPRMEPGVVVSVPAQLSLWPELGGITAATSFAGTEQQWSSYRAPWGWVLGNFTATYTPQSTVTPSAPLQLTAQIAPDHAGSFSINAFYGSNKVQLAVAGSRTVTARLNSTDVCSLVLDPNYSIVSLLVSGGVWTLKTSAGSTSGSATIPTGTNLSTVTLSGDTNTRASSFQASSPPAGQEFASLGYKSGYYQETSLFSGLMDVLPSYVNRPAIDLLTEISKANLAAMWFDEIGKFQFIGSDVLRNRAPSQTVTTLDDIYSLSWSDSRLGMRSKVRVKYRLPVLNRSKYSNVYLWHADGETMGSNQEKSLIAEFPADEEWFEIDDFTVSNAGGLAAFNSGIGTWVGGYLEDGSGNWTTPGSYATWSPITKLDERTRLFKVTTSTLPAGKTYVLATPDDAVNYFRRFRGFAYPILRGRARVKFVDAELSSATTGPYGFPELEHDAGPWAVQADNTLIQTRLADFIADQVTTPSPTITGMRVAYDPRRQLGDVITIDSPDLMGVTITALIVGVRNAAGDSFTQSLSVRIISASSTYTTYEQFNDAGGQLTYEQWNLLAPTTLNHEQFNDQTAEVA